MKLFKRIMSLLLTLTMLAGMVPPVTVNASETDQTAVDMTVEESLVSEDTMPSETEPAAQTTAPAETQMPENTAAAEETQAPETTEAPEVTEVPEATEAPEVTEVPEATEATQVPETTETVETTEATEETIESVIQEDAMAATSGTCGDNLTWSLNTTSGQLTISGKGAMTDYSYTGAPWYSERSSITSVVISSGVTSIGSYAFYNCFNMKSVTIPAGVTSIGTYAFYNCYYLTSATIPAGVTNINSYAFCRCSSLPSVVIGSGTTQIGEYAFSNCTDLTSVTLPDGLTTIASGVFKGCSSLPNVTIPASVTSIGSGAFTGCDSLEGIWVNAANTAYYSDASGVLYDKDQTTLIKAPAMLSGSYTIPETVTGIGSYTFDHCLELTDVTIPDSVTTIGNYAFLDCSGLTGVTFGNGVTKIGSNAFNNCTSLRNVSIPASVTSIGEKAFYACESLGAVIIPAAVTGIGSEAFGKCTNLTGIWVDKENTAFASDASGVLHNKSMQTLIQAPAGMTGSYTIRDEVTVIGSRAFDSCKVSNVDFGSSVASIGSCAFYNCDLLQSANLPDSLTTIGSNAFQDCGALGAVHIPASVTTISASSYYSAPFYQCSSGLVLYCGATSVPSGWGSSWNWYGGSSSDLLTVKWGVSAQEGTFWTVDAWKSNVVIPDYISTIPNRAFYNHTNLKAVTIPDGVTTIPAYAFYGCKSLTDVTMPCRLTSIGAEAFGSCTALADLSIPDTVISISARAFAECDSLLAVYIPQSVTTISVNSNGHGPFYGCDANLVLFCAASTLPGGWATKWNYYGTSNAYTLKVSWGISEAEGAFWTGEAKKADVVIPDTITRIPDYAFYNRKDLTSVSVHDGVTGIGSYAFCGCSGLTAAPIGSNVTEIGSYAFSGCSGLTKVAIPDGVTVIADRTFLNCTGLTEVTFGSGVTSIGTSAFFNCDGLTVVCFPEGVTHLGDTVLGNCSGLRAVYIPASVTTISSSSYSYSPFYGCESSVMLFCGAQAKPETWGTYWCYYGSYTLKRSWGVSEESFRFFASDAVQAEHVVIPDDVTDIPSYAFYNRKDLKSVTIGSGVAKIGSYAFYGCTGLKSLYIPANVTTISAASSSESPFYQCDSGMKLYCEAASAPAGWSTYWGHYTGSYTLKKSWGVDKVTYDFFSSDAVQAANVVIPDNVTRIPDYAFYGRDDLTGVTIGSGVTSIGSNAFDGCTGLKQLYIPATVQTITAASYTSGPFYGCDPNLVLFCGAGTTPAAWSAYWNYYGSRAVLKTGWGVSKEDSLFWLGDAHKEDVVIPDSITKIPSYAFYNRTESFRVTVPGSVETIASYAFYGASGLTELKLSEGVTSIGGTAFYNCTGLTALTIPDSVTTIGGSAFVNCSGLTEVTLGTGVETIGANAFYSCTGLKDIWFHGDPPEISSSSFTDVTANAHYPGANANWTAYYLKDYGGTLTWAPVCLEAHTPVTDEAVAPTCTETGMTEGSHCDVCGMVLTAQQEIPATGHTPAIDPAVPATCTEDGLTEGSHCAECDTVLTAQTVIPAAHTPVIDASVPPSCTQPGFTEGGHCDACGEILVMQQVVPAAHTVVTDPAVAPTCSEPGLTEGSHCSACGTVFAAQQEIPALGHSFEDGTCGGCGTITGSCGDNLTWTLENGLLTINGAGEMPDYSLGGAPWYSSRGTVTSLVIGPEVTGLGTYAFAYCTNLKTITFQGDEVSIGTNAFVRVTAEVTYRGKWSAEALQNYGGTLTWKDPCGGSHNIVTDEAVAPTCTETGLTEGSHCSGCGMILKEQTEIPALDHDMGDWETTREATCTEKGLHRRGCNRCDYYENRTSSAIGHDYASTVTDPGCESQGYTTYVCRSCSHSYTGSYTTPLGHAFGDWQTTLEKTCTTDGAQRRDCTRCGHFETGVLKATGHSYGSVVTAPDCVTSGYTTHTCRYCGTSYVDGDTKPLGHEMGKWRTVKAATCTAEGQQRRDCARCDYYETSDLDLIDHDYVSVVTASACETDGYTTHTCSSCGHSYVDGEKKALGHDLSVYTVVTAPTCTEDGTEKTACSRCDHFVTNAIKAAGHSYKDVVTEPDCENVGYTTHTCTICSYSHTDSEVAALGHALGEWEEILASTCTETGEERRDCGRCDHYETRIVELAAHTEQSLPAVEATCTETGLTEGKQCTVCQQITLAQEIVEAKGHSYVNFICEHCGEYASSSGNLGQDVTWEVSAEDGQLIINGSGVLEGTQQTPWEGYEDAITEIVIGEGVVRIDGGLFDDLNNLETVILPDTVTEIDPDAFAGCENLTAIVVGKDNPVYADHDGVLLSKDGTELILYPAGKQDAEYTVPGSVNTVGSNAFSGNPNLEVIRFTGAMPQLKDNAFQGLDVQVCYPGADPSWDPEKLQNYGGNVIWIPEYDHPEVISLTADRMSLRMGEETLLTARLNMQGDVTILWTVTEGSKAVKLLPNGDTAWLIANAVKEKTTVTVTAQVKGGVAKPAQVQVEILPQVQTLSVIRKDGGTVNGSTVWWDLKSDTKEMVFIAEVGPEGALKDVTWTISDEAQAYAAYNISGNVLTVSSPVGKKGAVDITATATDGSGKTTRFTLKFTELKVEQENPGEADAADVRLLSGKSKTLKVYDADSDAALTAKQILWTMDAIYAPYAKIAANGKITAKKVVEKVRVEAVGTIVGSAGTTVTVTVDIYPAVTTVELLKGTEVVSGKTIYVDMQAAALELKADIYPLDAMEGVSWTISDQKKQTFATYEIKDNVLKITPKVAPKKGTVTITATSDDGSKKTATVKLQFAAYAKTVTIDKSVTELTAGDKAVQLTAEMKPDVVTTTGIVWRLKNAADKSYVSLTSAGKITPKNVLAPVDVTVVAASKDGMAKDEHTIRILPKSAGQLVIKAGDAYVTKTTQILDVNTQKSITLAAYTYGGEKMTAVDWSPLTNKAAEIEVNKADGTLTIKMLSAGTITVTAKTKDGRKATVTVKGVKLAQDLVITKKNTKITEGLELASGKSVTLQATLIDAASKKVIWSVEGDSPYATVSASGKVTAAKNLTSAHKVTVKAVAADGSGAQDTMDIMVRPIAQGVQVYSEAGGQMLFSFRTKNWWVRSNTTLTWDLSTQPDAIAMDAHVFPYYNAGDDKNAIQNVNWKSSATKVADFQKNEDGSMQLKIFGTGSTTITVTAADDSNQKVTFKLKVVRTVTDLTIADQTVKSGQKLDLAKKITINPQKATNKKLTWKITDGENYATLSASGVFKANKVSTAKRVEVTVFSQDGGAKKTFYVTITP